MQNLRQIDKLRQKVGMVFQQFNLFPHMTVMRNITPVSYTHLSDGVGEGLDEIPEPASSCDEVRFQISKEYTPKYWNGAEGFATVEDVEDNLSLIHI